MQVPVELDLEKRKSHLNLGEVKELEKRTFGDDFYTLFVEDSPISYEEAIRSIDSSFWKEAIDNEIQSILQNQTWELTDLPLGCKPIGCKWVFKKKLRPNGSVDKYKARLVAKGFTQKP